MTFPRGLGTSSPQRSYIARQCAPEGGLTSRVKGAIMVVDGRKGNHATA